MTKIYVDGSLTRCCTVLDGIALIDYFLEPATVNQGEYYAVIRGLQRAIAHELKAVEILSDSQLVVRQLNTLFGKPTDVKYAIKNKELRSLADIVATYIDWYSIDATFVWIPREENEAGEILG